MREGSNDNRPGKTAISMVLLGVAICVMTEGEYEQTYCSRLLLGIKL